MSKSKAEVLVVHCVDTEGPIGGDVRRRPDGSKEFLDTWPVIKKSIDRLTSSKFRRESADSFGKPYMYNWFIMDFTGFKTNPKKRVAKYNDTYDHFKKFATKPDSFYWHYHHPPANGVGDQWSAKWSSSDEYLEILLHRLVEREMWPEAYRAGGTIEDNATSLWLEDTVMIDYSNRVALNSKRPKNIFDFNWHGAPNDWGFYHPDRMDLQKKGRMKRLIVRSVDLWSRINQLTLEDAERAFVKAKEKNMPVLLSYFSHDHRDMNDETRYAINLLKLLSTRHSVDWRTCNALEAVQRTGGITPTKVTVGVKRVKDKVRLKVNRPMYQSKPWVGAKLGGGSLVWLDVTKLGKREFAFALPAGATKVVVGGTSLSGDAFVRRITL